jgi:hypothetical protein
VFILWLHLIAYNEIIITKHDMNRFCEEVILVRYTNHWVSERKHGQQIHEDLLATALINSSSLTMAFQSSMLSSHTSAQPSYSRTGIPNSLALSRYSGVT